jgi:hypothetical protein
MANLVVGLSLTCVILCSWNLAQQIVIEKEPFAKSIGLTYGVMSMGAVAWLFAPLLPFGEIGVPLFIGGLAANLLVISLRSSRLYETD